MNDPSPENEAVCMVTGHHGWLLTLAFRHGTADSVLARDMCNSDEYMSTPNHLITASWPVDRPCVTLQTSNLCILENSEQVRALAQWMLAASIAMQRMEDEEDGFDAA